jgi:preprotein translocase subunit SecA
MHVQVVQEQQAQAPVQNVKTFSSDDVDASGAAGMQAAALAGGSDDGDGDGAPPAAAAAAAQEAPAMKPIVKDEMSKTPRNAPCPCGSGKKYKLCHGK